MHELNVGAATIRRRKEGGDPVGSEQSFLLYNLNMLYSDLNRSLYASGTAEEILTKNCRLSSILKCFG